MYYRWRSRVHRRSRRCGSTSSSLQQEEKSCKVGRSESI